MGFKNISNWPQDNDMKPKSFLIKLGFTNGKEMTIINKDNHEALGKEKDYIPAKITIGIQQDSEHWDNPQFVIQVTMVMDRDDVRKVYDGK